MKVKHKACAIKPVYFLDVLRGDFSSRPIQAAAYLRIKTPKRCSGPVREFDIEIKGENTSIFDPRLNSFSGSREIYAPYFDAQITILNNSEEDMVLITPPQIRN